VSTSDLGTKQLCPNCEAKFYDLNKRPAVCPKCQNSFEPDSEEVIAARTKVAAKVAPAAVKDTEDEDEEDAEDVKTAIVDEEEEGETIAELGDEDDPALAVADVDDEDDETTAKGVPAGFSEQGVDDDDILDDEAEEFDIDVDVDVDLGDDEDDLPGE